MSDPVDPKPKFEKECHTTCGSQWTKYQSCVKRINDKGKGTCEGWAMDYWTCVDKSRPNCFEC